jgi:hypothetical protein
MRDVVIDTDVASLLQKQQAPPWVLRHLAGARVWLTFVTVGELAKWAVVRKWGQDRRDRLDAWTATRPVIPYDTPRSPGCGVSWPGPPSCAADPAAERHLDRRVLPALPGPIDDAQHRRLLGLHHPPWPRVARRALIARGPGRCLPGLLPCGCGDERRDDVGRVPVQGGPGPVVAHRGSGIGPGGGHHL